MRSGGSSRTISSASGQGVEELKEYLWKRVEQAKASQVTEPEASWSEEDLE